MLDPDQIRDEIDAQLAAANPLLASDEDTRNRLKSTLLTAIGKTLDLLFDGGAGASGHTFPALLGSTTPELPSGGTTGQLLSKASGTDYDVEWEDVGPSEIGALAVDGSNSYTGVLFRFSLGPSMTQYAHGIKFNANNWYMSNQGGTFHAFCRPGDNRGDFCMRGATSNFRVVALVQGGVTGGGWGAYGVDSSANPSRPKYTDDYDTWHDLVLAGDLAPVATSSSASDLITGVLDPARLPGVLLPPYAGLPDGYKLEIQSGVPTWVP